MLPALMVVFLIVYICFPRMVAVWLWKMQNKAKLLALLDQNLPADDARLLRTLTSVTHAKMCKAFICI